MPSRRLDHLVDRLGAGSMTQRAGQAALRSPPPISVHDDGYVHGLRLRAPRRLDHCLDMIEVSIQGALAESGEAIDALGTPVLEGFRAG